jgi:UDP-N-acetyl-2-amino-2-deoxyglucuronate dehydrogenase
LKTVTDPIKVALVGCGRISGKHFEAFEKISALKLVAVCDVRRDRAEEAASANGVVAFTDLATLLTESEFDVLVVATPSGLHPEHGILAAEAGKHVVCEKPMAISLTAADALVSACDDAGVHLFIVKQNRLNPAVQMVKRAIDRGRFGRIYTVNATVRWTRPQEYYDLAPWRGTWEFDGGAFMNQASHYVDLVQWLVGPVERVMAKTATLGRNIEAEDTGVAILQFRNGALGVLDVTMLTYPKNFEGSITILGEKGTVRVGGTAVNRIEHWDFADYDDDDKLVESTATSPPNIYGFGHEAYYRNVVSVLKGEASPDTDGRSGRKSLELVLAAYESAKLGTEIPLPLKSDF